MWTSLHRLIQRIGVQHVALNDFSFLLDLGTEFLRTAGKTPELHRLLLKQGNEPTANVTAGSCQQNDWTVFSCHVCIVSPADRYNVPMFLFRKPSPSFIRAFLEEQAKLAFTYSAVGATADTPPLATSWTTPASSSAPVLLCLPPPRMPCKGGSNFAWAG